MRMNGKVCVVTGGARGIGKEIVTKFANEGALVVFACDMNKEALDELEKEFKNVKGYILNVTDREGIKVFVEKVKAEYGRIDALVNNAGITRDALIQKMTEEDWDAVINVNLKGVFNMTQAIGPLMMETGSGSIVSISSVVGLDGNIGQTNYAATKGGVVAMTKTWSKEFARKGAKVRANAVAPGFVRTPMTDKVPEKILEDMKNKALLKRLGEAEDIANAVLFLSSEEASFVTGQVLRVDGGLVI